MIHNDRFPLLAESEQTTLCQALHYMKMNELQKACLFLSLPNNGKKIQLIDRIMIFITTGKIVSVSKIPAQSHAKNYELQPLLPTSLMLYGEYKNDAKTRAFFKTLIGNHFHFTAYGIDWLNERWLQGKPPTYQEFADYWIHETHQRANVKVKPKNEWMFIRFIQTEPHASKDTLIHAWKSIQSQKADQAQTLLNKAKEKYSQN